MEGLIIVLLIYLMVFYRRVLKPYIVAGRLKAKMQAYRMGSYIFIPQKPINRRQKKVRCIRGIRSTWWNKINRKKCYAYIDEYYWDVVEIEPSRLKNPFVYETFNDVQLKALLNDKEIKATRVLKN
ncbi:hypothetical protein ACX8XN_18560 [Calditrichota bacterium GD2]